MSSICENCRWARRVGSDGNHEKGYIGCAMRLFDTPHKDHLEIDAEIVAEGWVRQNAWDSEEKSGRLFNYQLITKNTRSCGKYTEK